MTDIISANDGLHPLPTRPIGSRGKQIIKEVAAEHHLSAADLTKNHDRFPRHVAARREAILRMHAVGLSLRLIGLACNLHRTTVAFHLNPELRARKLKLSRIWRAAQAARAAA